LDDDFFAVGGDSVLGMHLVGRLRQLTGLEIRMRLLFETPVLRTLSARIVADQAADTDGTAPHGDPRAVIRAAFEAERAK
jgi:hypothetical protein